MARNYDYPPVTPKTYRISLPANTEFEFVSAHTIFPYKFGNTGSPYQTTATYTQIVYLNGLEVFRNEYIIYREMFDERYKGENIGFKTRLKNGETYKVTYSLDVNYHSGTDFTNTVSYYISVVENKLPLDRKSTRLNSSH